MTKTMIIIYSLVIAVYIVYLFVQIDLSTSGAILNQVQQTTQSLVDKNSFLKEQILQESSLVTVDRKARAMGFVDMKSSQQIYLK